RSPLKLVPAPFPLALAGSCHPTRSAWPQSYARTIAQVRSRTAPKLDWAVRESRLGHLTAKIMLRVARHNFDGHLSQHGKECTVASCGFFDDGIPVHQDALPKVAFGRPLRPFWYPPFPSRFMYLR